MERCCDFVKESASTRAEFQRNLASTIGRNLPAALLTSICSGSAPSPCGQTQEALRLWRRHTEQRRLRIDSGATIHSQMGRLRMLWQMIFDERGDPPPASARPNPASWSDQEITGSCLGHSTVLLNFLGLWVLTDPMFSKRAGPGIGSFILGPKRYLAPALKLREAPAPDLILSSHAHFDHLDTGSLRWFSRHTPIVMASRTRDLLPWPPFKNVHELSWGQTVTIATRAGAVRCTALEVVHWGARMMRDDWRGYNGYLLERAGRRVLFGGDTAFTHAFAPLRESGPPIDLALLPIGAYDPWIRTHCNPEQAAAMAREAGARTFVPIHHETFKLSSEPMEEPAARIRTAFAHEPERLLAVRVGETFRVPLQVDFRS